MKSAFLILYFWHAGSFTITSGGGANGGPVLQVVSMPSLAVCEQVGQAVKALVDAQRPRPHTDLWEMNSQPAAYRCIEAIK